jgi:hypothetical protein
MAEEFDPDKFLAKTETQSDFDPDAFLAQNQQPSEPERKRIEAGIQGVLQEGTVGFLDELAGVAEAAGQAVGIKGLGQEFGKQELQKPLGLDMEGLLDAYRSGRDVRRERLEQLEKDEPTAFTTGQVAGMVAPVVATGGAAAASNLLTRGAGKTLGSVARQEAKKQAGRLAASGATVGGAGAAGFSEKDILEEPEELLKDVAMGAGLGAAISTATPSALKIGEKAAKSIGRGIKTGTKQLTSVLAGLKDETLEEVLKRADDIKNVVDYPEIGEMITEKALETNQTINKLSAKATEILPTEKTVPKSKITNLVADRIKKIANTADEPAIPELNKIVRAINTKEGLEGSFISLRDLQDIVQDTGRRAYRGVSSDAPGAVKEQLRKTYRDLSETLKEAAPSDYKPLMDEMSKRFDTLNQLEKKLGIKIDFDKAQIEGQDKLVRKLQEVGKPDALGTERVDIENLLAELQDLQGVDIDQKRLEDLLKARRLKGLLEKGSDEYSYAARTIAGSILAAPFGPAAAPVGAAVGLASRPVARSLLQKSGALSKLPEKASRATEKIVEKAAPAALGLGLSSGSKKVVEEDMLENKLQDTDYLSGLLEQIEQNPSIGTETYRNQLREYSEAESLQERNQIEYNLAQQPAFRKLIKRYEESKK